MKQEIFESNDIVSGDVMYGWARDLFGFCRSLTGPGVRETLSYLTDLTPGLTTHSVPSGTEAFDWSVPEEWTIREAYIEDESGTRILDFNENNLHLVGYSVPIDQWMDLEELDAHLHSLPDQPDAIPYVTSYYSRRWGFCLSHKMRQSLEAGRYRAYIDSDIKSGIMNYGELIIEGDTKEEVLLSTYICHPSMANNEISGPVVTTALAQWLTSLINTRYTYRIVFVPETIGSIVYLSHHFQQLRESMVAGFVVTCVGDDRTYSFLPSRKGTTLSDRVAEHVLHHMVEGYDRYTYLERGSDERQYCSPGIDLPVCSIMRSKYGTYPEYHTSLDNLDLISPAGLEGSFRVLQRVIKVIEENYYYRAVFPCEPQLGKRGMYPTLSKKGSADEHRLLMDVLAYADGEMDLIDLANCLGEDVTALLPVIKKLRKAELLNRLR
jgi:aminopeptidase-like protein